MDKEVDSTPITQSLFFYSPDIHTGTKVDLASSLLHFNQSLMLSSISGPLPSYYHSPFPILKRFNHSSQSPQLVYPKKLIVSRRTPINAQSEADLKYIFNHTSHHPLFRQVDAVICMFYPGQCQLFIPFNKTVVFVPAHRFLLQRCSPRSVHNLMYWMFSNVSNVIVRAASVYDAEYINYYTGRTVPVIQSSSLFAYSSPTTFNPSFEEVLVGPFKSVDVPFLTNLTNACIRNGYSCSFTTVLTKLGRSWKWEDLPKFKAIIVFPYAVLSYYLNDIFASCVPLFVPSPQFLLSLHILTDSRNSDEVYCGRYFVPPPRHPNSRHLYDPENPSNLARLYWLRFASFYSPATVQFDSWDDLVRKLHSTNLTEMFLKRKKENEQVRNHNTNEWKQLLREISVNRSIPASYQEALRLFQVESFFTFSVCNKHSKPLET
ncbi:hypothetical protein JH06_0422 [Blastocystis sp. subtype 4]|uniref:hypothetical protein n=1 Tax=Blastocystis sp. subtype 4 TaxID=944170 RepID=UPI0007122CA7|nr:hypothetical protein JH06_0422 [Blastocystis sp. subtype 4]KNB45996.1 hypothetical protein JH06_0422 [Blastocystis sp. subtype 4]|eukprot:XP_014529439.1 hypothetical protein JH06_0422 [Blastocystis sp. subtype 4]